MSIVLWNCNSVKNKLNELQFFIQKFNFSIIALNETKTDHTHLLDIPKYTTIRKDRTKNGGGVALLISQNTQYVETHEYDDLGLEVLSIDVFKNNQKTKIINMYVPSGTCISIEFLDRLKQSKEQILLCGDLNSKSDLWFNSKSNNSGRILENFIIENNFMVLNDQIATYYSTAHKSNSILDLFICSASIAHKFSNFEVYNNDFGSDHHPIIIEIDILKQQETQTTSRVNYDKMNIDIYHDELNKNINKINFGSSDIEEINQQITDIMFNAANKSLPKTKAIRTKFNLPRYILDLINLKGKLRNKNKKTRTSIRTTKINYLSKLIKLEIKSFKQAYWKKFCTETRPSDLSTARCWKTIKSIEGKSSIPKTIPAIIELDRVIVEQQDKAELFGQILAETFSENTNNLFNNQHKSFVEDFIKNNDLFKQTEFEPFNIQELQQAIEKLKKRSSAGPDKIHNVMIKNASNEFKNVILKLFNLSISNQKLPSIWKQASVTMIPKKGKDKSLASSYRPISLTSCLAKTCERLTLNRLQVFLKSKDIIIKQQSGFRSHRQTNDNLVYLLQKVKENFNKKKMNTVAVFFDIEKAFDKVWHSGLIYKLHQYGLPKYLGYWIVDFLRNRTFSVKVDKSISNIYTITAGVPQGAVLSPTLFSLFINDIPLTNQYQKGESSLFADDLAHLNQDRNLKRLEIHVQRYLYLLQDWLSNWRLSMSAQKCSYVLFGKNSTINSKHISLKLYENEIPRDNNPRYLGAILDPQLNFKPYLDFLATKANQRLNIIKFLSSKPWAMDSQVLLNIYKVMIRSVFEYCPAAVLMTTQASQRRIQSIEYQSIRRSMHLPSGTSTSQVYQASNLEPIKERILKLNKQYVLKAVTNNEFIKTCHAEYKTFKEEHNVPKYPTYFCNVHISQNIR